MGGTIDEYMANDAENPITMSQFIDCKYKRSKKYFVRINLNKLHKLVGKTCTKGLHLDLNNGFPGTVRAQMTYADNENMEVKLMMADFPYTYVGIVQAYKWLLETFLTTLP